jgi:hypothetical protein
MSADPVLTAALALDGACPFGALRIALPGHTICLLDGSATIIIGGETYTGRDDVFGGLLAIEAIEESQDAEAPALRIVLQPPGAPELATLADANMQGSEVRVMVGCCNLSTGQVIGTPEVIFLGEIDVPRARLAKGVRQVEFSCTSVFERFFEVDEGERVTDAFHQARWPGELGLSMISTLNDPAYWGSNPPVGALAPAGGSTVTPRTRSNLGAR